MGNRASAPPSKGGPTPSTNPQVPNPYGSQFQPQRYSNDYFRYQQSGDAFNQPVMGYGTYGQIFTPPPQRFRPQPLWVAKAAWGIAHLLQFRHRAVKVVAWTTCVIADLNNPQG